MYNLNNGVGCDTLCYLFWQLKVPKSCHGSLNPKSGVLRRKQTRIEVKLMYHIVFEQLKLHNMPPVI